MAALPIADTAHGGHAARTRQILISSAESGCLSQGLSLQPVVLGHQLLRRFDMIGVDRNALDRAHLHALGLVEVPHALGALVGVDDVDGLAHRDGLIGTLGLAHITVDAFFGDCQCHGVDLLVTRGE